MRDQDSKEHELEGLEKEIDHAIDSLFVEKGIEREKTPSPPMGTAPSKPVRTVAQDSGEDKLEGLEKDIDHAIDSLFVEKGGEREKAPSPPMGLVSSEPVKTPVLEPAPPAQRPRTERPSRGQEPVSRETDGPMRNLENLETHLLSLEWEISPDLIDKIISELGFLKDAYGNNRAIFQVLEIMGKVAHSLADDEGNITPESLRFLLEAKDGIKLLCDELRDKEDYKNVVLSGILARYRLLREESETSAEGRDDSGRGRDFEDLTKHLRRLSHKLQDEIRQLGTITQKLQGRDGLLAPSGMVGTVLMESSGRVFAIEKDIVVGSVQIPYRMVRTIWKDREIRIRGASFPLINLFRLLKLKGRVEAKDKTVVLIKKNDRTLAVLVDRLLQKKEIPSKSIRGEKGLAYIRGVAPMERGRNLYFLDSDRMMVEF